MHVGEFVRGKGYFAPTPYVATDERSNSKYPLLLTTGRILSHYNVGAQTRRTDNSDWATNCPEYKVTAVQAYPVSHPSEWQKMFHGFNEKQQELLAAGRHNDKRKLRSSHS